MDLPHPSFKDPKYTITLFDLWTLYCYAYFVIKENPELLTL